MIRLGNSKTKKNKRAKLKNRRIFLKTNNFKVIKTIQRVYDEIRLYRRALRPVIIQFLWLQKEQQIEATNKNSIRTYEKTLVQPYFVPQNMFN